jgi:peptide/nickel transport system substrate-binding protein
MKRRDFLKTTAAGGLAAAALRPGNARAQAARETLLTISESGPNGLDTDVPGANRSVFEVNWNIYDRLVTFGVKKDENGNDYYDYKTLQPELAEDWDLRDMSVTLKLKRGVRFHDGAPVTAKDVKWAFDRAIGVGGYPKSTMGAASLTKPEQFVVVDDRTFRVDFHTKDKLSMLYLGVPVVGIYNSEVVKKHATSEDPWAQEWTKLNTAGSGAFKVERWTPGQEIVFVRNDDWKCGKLPQLRRVVWRPVPAAGTRRALLERGDVDFSYDLPPKDASEMAANKNLKIVGSVMENAVQYLGMNVKMAPFDNVKVRQAIAYAIPYQKIMDVAMYGRAKPLFGGPAKVSSPEWPQATGYRTDFAKAKQLLAEAGYPNGFETTLSFDLGAAVTNEPLCILVQEALGQIGIKVNLEKIPGANWRATFMKKNLPLQTNFFGAWFNYPDFFFYFVYSGENTIFNTMAYSNPEMDKAIADAHYTTDAKAYQQDAIKFIQIAFDEVPNVPLYQPYLNVAMRNNISGYRYWFHRQVDYRPIVKA